MIEQNLQIQNANSENDLSENRSDAANAWRNPSEKARSPLLYKNIGMPLIDAQQPDLSQQEDDAFLAPFEQFSGEQPA